MTDKSVAPNQEHQNRADAIQKASQTVKGRARANSATAYAIAKPVGLLFEALSGLCPGCTPDALLRAAVELRMNPPRSQSPIASEPPATSKPLV
jgi:hypothetical protein